MAAYPRPAESNGSVSWNHLRSPAMYVLPLNSMPYVGAPVVENGSLPTHAAVEPPRSQPVVLMSAEPTPEELKRILKAIKGTVVLTGSAASGVIGPHIGKMNVSDSDNSYRFLLSLPGVLRDEKEFSCDIDCEGKVVIRGMVTTGEQIVCRDGEVYNMLSRNLGPSGRFSLAFYLPGPVDHLQFSGSFRDGGMLEGIVKKL